MAKKHQSKPVETEEKAIGDLTPDPNNANRHTERGTGLLESSIRRLGAGRSILMDKHGRIIAGNATHEAAGSVGLEDVIVVKTDGTKLVAVQRTDLDLETDLAAMELAVADNRIGEVNLDLDANVLQALSKGGVNIEAAGISPDELAAMLEKAAAVDPDQQDRQEMLEGKITIRFCEDDIPYLKAFLGKGVSLAGRQVGARFIQRVRDLMAEKVARSRPTSGDPLDA